MSLTRRIGTISFIIGNLTIFAAFGFAAQSLLASLESVQFISNIFFARYLHKEPITKRILLSTFAIIVGNILVLIFSDHSAPLLNSHEIIQLYLNNTAYHAYLVVAGVLFFFNHFIFIHYYNARVIKKSPLWRQSFIEPLTFSISSTLIGSQAILDAKCMSLFIQVSVRGTASENEFEMPTLWVILFVWLILVVYWLKRLDLGLALFPPAFIIPVLQVFYMFFAIICGGIFFGEFSSYNTIQTIFFTIGVVLILGGVFGLAPAKSDVLPSKITENMVNNVVQQVEELPENIQSFKRDISIRINNFRRSHPITDLLRSEIGRRNSDDKNMSPALKHFRRMSKHVERERLGLGDLPDVEEEDALQLAEFSRQSMSNDRFSHRPEPTVLAYERLRTVSSSPEKSDRQQGEHTPVLPLHEESDTSAWQRGGGGEEEKGDDALLNDSITTVIKLKPRPSVNSTIPDRSATVAIDITPISDTHGTGDKYGTGEGSGTDDGTGGAGADTRDDGPDHIDTIRLSSDKI